MIHQLGVEAFEALQRALCGSYVLPVCGGSARIVSAALPGRAICAAAMLGGVLWVVLDFDKPGAPRHARAMLTEWRAAFLTADTVDEELSALLRGAEDLLDEEPPARPTGVPVRLRLAT